MRRRVAIGGVAAALIVIAVVFALGGSNSDHGTPTVAKPAAPKPRAPRHTTPSHQADHRRRRAGVVHRPGRPDEPAPGSGPLLAIADQKPATFSDPLFRSLGVARTRLNTPWNSIFTEPARLDAWLSAVHDAGIEPLIAFEHARGDACPAQPCDLPPLGAYRRAVTAFHRRYPWVHLLQPWNEANSSTQPTGLHPEAAARFYQALRGACPSCTIVAADLLDGSNLVRWLARFRAALTGPTPQLWGLHNYSDANRFHDSGTRRFLALVPGEIWFTEAGGIVSFTTADGRRVLPYDEQRAARATQYLFHLAALSPRIKRVYIYQWKIDFPGNRFDAGLVSLDGKPRPALQVVLRHRSLLR